VVTLPPGAEAGLSVKPFRGIRYAPDRVGDIAGVTSPPYDVIGSGVLASLLASSPYNIVRLILPGPETGGPPSYPAANALAADRLGEWLGSGVLVRDPGPAFYIYEQNGSSLLQRGLIALVGVGPPAETGIFPHEGVMPGPVAGRRSLMLATRANLEPIFLVYNGGASGESLIGSGSGSGSWGGSRSGDGSRSRDGFRSGGGPTTSGLVDQIAENSAPLAEAVTSDGVTHRLWRVSDPAAVAAIEADLAGRTALIADGHHRYAAYRELRDSMRAAGLGAGPWDYGLAFLADADSYPPRLGAIHRDGPVLAAHPAGRRAAGRRDAVRDVTAVAVPGRRGAAGAPAGGPVGHQGQRA
jgi:uncharacterized protein (DUF1015 family)